MEQTAKQLVEQLSARGWRIAFAESCTAGLAAATLASVSGASRVMEGALVTYSVAAKCRLLGVMQETVDTYTVYSEEVAREMAEGASRKLGTEVAVGITGIAGPTGALPDKPVGTVSFGYCIAGRTCTETVRFSDLDRAGVRTAAVAHAFDRLLTLIASHA